MAFEKKDHLGRQHLPRKLISDQCSDAETARSLDIGR